GQWSNIAAAENRSARRKVRQATEIQRLKRRVPGPFGAYCSLSKLPLNDASEMTPLPHPAAAKPSAMATPTRRHPRRSDPPCLVGRRSALHHRAELKTPPFW